MIDFGVGVILPSAGRGERMECSTPKQYCRVLGKPLFTLALEAFNSFLWVKKIVLVVDNTEYVDNLLDECGFNKEKLLIVSGEKTRHRSIRSGIRALQKYDLRVVIVHDAVRPFLSRLFIEELVLAAVKYGAAGATRPLVSTVLASDSEGFLQNSLDRSRHLASETPQAFQMGVLLSAYDQCSEEDLDNGTECLQLALDSGVKARLIAGPPDLWKVTYQKDIYTAIGCLKERTSRVCVVGDEENNAIWLLTETLKKKVSTVTRTSPPMTAALRDTYNILVVFHFKKLDRELELTIKPLMDVKEQGLVVHVIHQASIETMKNTSMYEVHATTSHLTQTYKSSCQSTVVIYCLSSDNRHLVDLVTSLVLSDYTAFSGQTLLV